MAFTLPALPYDTTALAPYLSAETFEYHYGKHHKTYVDTLNGMIEPGEEEQVAGGDHHGSEGKKFNKAAQVWNHNLYWKSMAPGGGGAPTARPATPSTRRSAATTSSARSSRRRPRASSGRDGRG